MKKRLLAALFCGMALPLSATVVPFACYSRPDGRPLLIPEVREYRAAAGVVRFPAELAVAVPAGEELVVEEIAEELKRFGIKTGKGGENAFFRFTVGGRDLPKHPQGYRLVVSPRGVDVAASTTAGLFHGAQTVRNLLRNAAEPELKCCEIIDRPSFTDRSYQLNLRNLPADGMPLVKRTVEAMAALKFNILFLATEERFPYRDNPFAGRVKTFSREELADLVEFCRRRHIEVIPSVQVWTHALWMTRHPHWNAMSEGKPARPWSSSCCPLNEEARELTRKVLKEQSEFFRCKRFYINYDEIFLCPFGVCPKCKKVEPRKLLADYLDFVYGVLDECGATMMCDQDSFVDSPRWKHGDWYRTRLRKETSIRWWCYRDRLPEKEMEVFREFKLMGHAVCGKPFNVWNMARLTKKNGGDFLSLIYWYYSDGGIFGKLETETPDSLGGFVNGADYAWNLRDTHYSQLGYDGTFEMMRLLWPEKLTLPPRSGEASPMPISGAVNAELSESGEFPRFADDAAVKEFSDALAALPEKFRLVTSPGGKYYAARISATEEGRAGIAFPFGDRKAEHLSFLLTASRPRNGMDYFCARIYGKKRFTYAPAARLTFLYADGTKEFAPLGYRREITDWNRPFGGFGMRFAARGFDADRNFVTFGIFDWRNPHPAKPIRRIVISGHRLDGISPALLAVSAWGVERPFGKSGFKVDPSEVAKRDGVPRSAPTANLRTLRSFDRGLDKDIDIICSPSLRKSLKYEIVDDPASPAGGKVLKLTAEPGDYRGIAADNGFLSISLEFPCAVPKGTQGLFTDVRLTSAVPTDFSHANDYLQGEGTSGHRDLRVFLFRPDAHWRRDIHSKWNGGHRAMKDVTGTRTRMIRFFFRRITGPVEIRLGLIGDTTENISTVPLWQEGTEAEPI